jgi:hypothetical protein
MDNFRVIKENQVIEDLLLDWENVLGDDYVLYRNHVYRVFNYAMYLNSYQLADETNLATAAVFHDLGIWTHQTLDYLEYSVSDLKEYIEAQQLGVDFDLLSAMIRNHHKMNHFQNKLVEIFRRSDLIDTSKGYFSYGIHKHNIQLLRENFPNAGFHALVLKKTLKQFFKRPFNLLPFLR